MTIISRDRGGIYAEGATAGAPNAIQVAGRWHILKNLVDALLRVFQQQHQALDKAFTASSPFPSANGAAQLSGTDPAAEVSPAQLTRREQEQQTRHAGKLARHERVRHLHQQGGVTARDRPRDWPRAQNGAKIPAP